MAHIAIIPSTHAREATHTSPGTLFRATARARHWRRSLDFGQVVKSHRFFPKEAGQGKPKSLLFSFAILPSG